MTIGVHPLSLKDERTGRVLNALASNDLDVEWARPEEGLEGGPVLLFWSRKLDTGKVLDDPDIARLALNRQLVSVLIEKVPIPQALPHHTIVDLIGWRGSLRNPFFGDLVAALQAAETCTVPPRQRGPLIRLLQRACGGLTVFAVCAFLVAFFLNLLELQNNLCSINFSQPQISDFCGGWGLGGKPTKKERLDWEARPAGSCEALRKHIDAYPDGALHGLAADMLAAQRTVTDEAFVVEDERYVFSWSIAADAAPSREAAQAHALVKGGHSAEEACKSFAASDYYKLLGTQLDGIEWSCFATNAGHFCGFDGYRICRLERLVKTGREVCGELDENPAVR